jgi:hypothetical protein
MPNDGILPPGENPLDPYVKEIDPVAFALNKVRVSLAWIDEHRASFEVARESDPETAERELRYLDHSTRDARQSMGRLVELLMTGNTIDLTRKLPRDLQRWRTEHMP